MSASVGDGNGQEVELNLAPIIDCFTVLITYLLVTASFITLSAMDVGVSATGTAAAPLENPGPPPMVMTLEMKVSGEVTIRVRGGTLTQDQVVNVMPRGAGWDLEELTTRLTALASQWPALTEASVSADPTVVYKDIVTVIHTIQNVMPKVFISG